MKSQIIQTKKQLAEQNHKINFVNFIQQDLKTYNVSPSAFPNLEPVFKSGLKLVFNRELSSGETISFMTIVWPSDFVYFKDMSLNKTLSFLVGKKLRLYEGIFECPYFDFEDQCLTNQILKFSSHKIY